MAFSKPIPSPRPGPRSDIIDMAPETDIFFPDTKSAVIRSIVSQVAKMFRECGEQRRYATRKEGTGARVWRIQ